MQRLGLCRLGVVQQDFSGAEIGQREGDGAADAAGADQQHAARRLLAPACAIGGDEAGVVGVEGKRAIGR